MQLCFYSVLVMYLCCLIFSEKSDEEVSSILKKLLFFTILMVSFPIGSYFASKSYFFEGQ